MAKLFSRPFANTGDKTAIAETSDDTVNYTTGYTREYTRNLATDSTAKPIERRQFNQFFHDVTDNIKDWQKNTFAEHKANTEYTTGSIVRLGTKTWIARRTNSVVPAEGDDWTEFTITNTINANFGKMLGNIPTFDDNKKTGAIDAIIACGTNSNGSWWFFQSGKYLMGIRTQTPSNFIAYTTPVAVTGFDTFGFFRTTCSVANLNADRIQYALIDPSTRGGRYFMYLLPNYRVPGFATQYVAGTEISAILEVAT